MNRTLGFLGVAGLLCAPATAFASAGAGLGQPASGPAITQQAQVTPDANADGAPPKGLNSSASGS